MKTSRLRTASAIFVTLAATTAAVPAFSGTAVAAAPASAARQQVDFNGDGHEDMYASVPDGTVSGLKKAGYLVVYPGDAKGIGPARHQVINQNTSGVPGSAAANARFGAGTPADIDRDGYTDLLVSAYNGPRIILFGGKGGLGTRAVEYRGQGYALGDFDGDGRTDAAGIDSTEWEEGRPGREHRRGRLGRRHPHGTYRGQRRHRLRARAGRGHEQRRQGRPAGEQRLQRRAGLRRAVAVPVDGHGLHVHAHRHRAGDVPGALHGDGRFGQRRRVPGPGLHPAAHRHGQRRGLPEQGRRGGGRPRRPQGPEHRREAEVDHPGHRRRAGRRRAGRRPGRERLGGRPGRRRLRRGRRGPAGRGRGHGQGRRMGSWSSRAAPRASREPTRR